MSLRGRPELADDGLHSGVNKTDHRPHLAGVLALVKDLAGLIHSDSTADLFGHAFHTLVRTVPFDVGVAMMLEQNIDLYISARPEAAKFVSEPLVERVRDVLHNVIPAQFTSTEIMVRDDRRTLQTEWTAPPGLDHDMHTVLRQETRTAGLLSSSLSS